MHNDFILELKNVLQEGKLNKEAQNLMFPEIRLTNEYGRKDYSKPKKAGVLVLLYPIENKLFTVFTRRTKNGKSHKGEISFAGGKYEEDDDSLVETAIREANEEIGVLKENLTILGKLSMLYIPISNFDVLPVVAYSNTRPNFKKSVDEVKKIIEIPLSELFDDDKVSVRNVRLNDESYKIPYFSLKNCYIWGATAMMLSELKEIVRNLPNKNY